MLHLHPRSDTRRKIAVVGGGLSGLSAAYELSRTADLRARYEVTVYTSGHRLGGKLASGRNREAHMRNEEVGLHVWFGFYENAFRLGREIYERWQGPEDARFRSLEDVMSPQSFTPFGVGDDGASQLWPLSWPTHGGTPGLGEMTCPTLTVRGVLRILYAQIVNVANACDVALPKLPAPFERWLMTTDGGRPVGPRLRGGIGRGRAIALHRALVAFHAGVSRTLSALPQSETVRVTFAGPIDMLLAVARGLCNPNHRLYEDFDLDRIDHLDFREWLKLNGASAEALAHEGLRFAYDACFQYMNGRPDEPDFSAATALRIMLRLGLTTQGAALYLFDAGMGEALVAPLHEVLVEQGVRFEFFHHLRDVSVRECEAVALDFIQQATPRTGDYIPTFEHRGMKCWPIAPDWDQLEGGDELSTLGVDFESGRGHNPFERRRRLSIGVDFDDVVLAVPLGVLASEASPARQLLEMNPRLRACARRINLAPTAAAQLWLDRPVDRLHERFASPSWAAPFDVMADMGAVTACEDWPAQPAGALYLCGAVPNDTDDASARDALTEQLRSRGSDLWSAFDWDVLCDPTGQLGEARMGAQYVRVNSDPSNLCDGGNSGTARFRLEAHESGVQNLALSGTYLRTGINSTCVEAAVMAGMAAARAVHGQGRDIIGESFMARAFDKGSLPPERLARTHRTGELEEAS